LAVGVGYVLGTADAEAEREREARVAANNRAQQQQRNRNATARTSCDASPPARSDRPVRLLNPDGTPYNGRVGPAAAAATSANSAAAAAGHDDDAHLCKVCLDAPNDHLFTPCGHQAACGPCASQCARCPVCREEVLRVVKVYKC